MGTRDVTSRHPRPALPEYFSGNTHTHALLDTAIREVASLRRGYVADSVKPSARVTYEALDPQRRVAFAGNSRCRKTSAE